MGYPKLNRKGTITQIFLTIVIITALFSGMYLYLNDGLSNADLTMESKYQDAYGNITERQQEVDEKTQDIREAVTNIQESESVLDAGLTSIKGAYKALLLVPTVITTGLGLLMDIIIPLDFLPAWAIGAAISIITIFVVFVVLKAILGRNEL